MPAVSLNAGTPNPDSQGEVTVSNFNANGGFGYIATTTPTTELVLLISFSVNVSAIALAYGGTDFPSGTPLVQEGSAITGTGCGWTYCFHLTHPPTTIAGQGLFGSWTGAASYRYRLMLLDNAAGGVKNFTSATGSSATASTGAIATGGANDAVFAAFQNVSTQVFGAQGGGETQIDIQTDGILHSAADYILAPAASQTMTNALAGSDNWVAVGVNIANVAAAGAPTTTIWLYQPLP